MVKFRARHILTSVSVMGVMAYFAIYVNSALASVDYSSGSAVVESVTNFFFVYGLPVDLFAITEKWQWLLYFFCLVALVAAVFALMYLPFILKNRKQKRQRKKFPAAQLSLQRGGVFKTSRNLVEIFPNRERVSVSVLGEDGS